MNPSIKLPNYTYILIALIILIIVLAYKSTLSHQFVWDDGYFATGWQEVRDISTHWPTLLKGHVPMSYGQVYRPIRSLFYALSTSIWDMNPSGYHFQALAIHLINTVLIYLIANHLFRHQATSFITALLFGLHPLNTEAVSWITASFDTFGILFFFLSFYLYLIYRSQKKPKYLYLTLALTFIAFFSYELTFVLIPLIIIYDFIILKQKYSFKAFINQYQYFFLILLFYIFIRLTLLASISNQQPYLFNSPFQTFLFIPVILGNYLKILLIPVHQSINHTIYPSITNFYHVDLLQQYQNPQLNLASSSYILPFILVIVLVLAIVKTIHRKPIISFLLSWIALSFLPVLQIIPQNSVFAERYAYIASFGFCALIAYGIYLLASKIHYAAALFVLAVIASTYFFLTYQRNQTWSDTVTLWQTAAHQSSHSAYIYRNLGASYYITKNYPFAIHYYQLALSLNPSHTNAYKNLAILYNLQNNHIQSIQVLEELYELSPQDHQVINMMADSHHQIENYQESLELYQQSLTINPHQTYPQTQINLLKQKLDQP